MADDAGGAAGRCTKNRCLIALCGCATCAGLAATVLVLAYVVFASPEIAVRNPADDPFLPGNQTTGQGCMCKADSVCGASHDEHNRCDWCHTDENCGEHAIHRGWHDHCVFADWDKFEQMTHQEKMDELWQQVVANTSRGPSVPQLARFRMLVKESMITSMDNSRESMPNGRVKFIHALGTVFKFDLEVGADSNYTGLFAPGTYRGLMRLSSGSTAESNVFPGLGFKFLRTGMTSANSVLLRETGPFDAEGNIAKWQFFEVPQSNHVPPPMIAELLSKFSQASGCSAATGLSDICSFYQNGTLVEGAPVFPFEIRFVAVEPMKYTFDYNTTLHLDDALLDALASVPKDTHLYDVFAKESPTAPWAPLGRVVTRSESTKSWWGDVGLFFRHQRIEEDYRWHPDWEPHMARDLAQCAESKYANGDFKPLSVWQCPFAPGAPLHPKLPPIPTR